MGKPKKGSKDVEIEEASDNDSRHENVAYDSDEDDRKAAKNVADKSKKSKNKAKIAASESEDEQEVNNKKTSKKESKKKSKKNADDDGIPSTTVSAFNLLKIEDSDDGGNDVKSEEESTNKKGNQKKKNKNKKESEPVEEEPAPTGGKKGKGKKKKGGDDEDWDAILAEYQEDPKPEPTKAEEPKKKDKKKGQTPAVVEQTPPPAPVEEPEKQPAKKKDKKKKKDEQPEESTEKPAEAAAEKPAEAEPAGGAAAKKKKGPNKALVAAMQEALKKKQEEDERLQREEEEKIKALEEADRLKKEKERIEQERKEQKKQKEKERKERLKAEGKLLTAKQKADRARAEAMIQSLKAQGVDVPGVGEKREARPSARSMRQTKNKKDEAPPTEESKKTEESQEKLNEQQQTEAVPEPPKEEIKDSWDVDSDGEDKQEATPEPEKKQASKAKEESSDDESDTETESDEDDSDESDDEPTKDEHHEKDPPDVRIKKREVEAERKRTTDNLRAAVVCVLGHVDTGKTKILDKLRRTNVQDGEAGGITQQIGATNVPIDALKENTKHVKGASEMEFRVPGLLIIDTPGHESFSNLRNRGSSLCDIAILVVDIMHGLEPQTIESLNLLKSRKTPFVVALNKIDRLYDWQTMQRKDVRDIIKAQAQNTQNEFEKRTKEVILQFAEQGLNAALFYENTDTRTFVSLVPTSAITGEGMGNLLMLIVQFSQNQLAKRLAYSEALQATVLEVKAIQGLGTTVDAILVNGKLREGDTMIIAGTEGPIVTQIRALLMPHPMKELRVKNNYIEQKEVIGAQGVKIAAKELEKAVAGINLQIAQEPDEVDYYKRMVAKDLASVLRSIKLSDQGVFVQASTLGSLEALLEFLKASKIPYAGIRIGPVVKRDVMKASIMLEHQAEYATILAFDVKIERDAQDLADNLGVKIFQADIIYHLFDKFTAYREELKQQKRDQFKSIAVFPCKLKILPQYIFNSRDPIVMGVTVEAGIVKEGTPICVVKTKDDKTEIETLGIVASIENNHKNVPTARKGLEVCVKIEPLPGETPKMFGRHFDENDMLLSKISRESIDACKDYFRDELVKTDWTLMVELKKLFGIL
ncbi:eukaryotic translation initiation factor 5B [Chironomus tepperi]|uniref:eukaryotic translation initiation factor 5B n=1 Tax=Chironomus tepperi TaxID=113505 RepID=UPI00391FC275